MTHVIAIAGPIGSGKTTLAGKIAAALGGASVLQYDSYEVASRQAPGEVVRWIRDGADFNAFVLPDLVRDLSALKEGIPVTDPLSGKTIRGTEHVVFEMPLGKEHRATAPFIDLLAWIDVPLDIALARKMAEYTERFIAGGAGTDGLDWLGGYLDNYLAMIRPLMEIQHARVRPGADIIIDGRADPSIEARRAAGEIRKLLSTRSHQATTR